MKILTIYRLPQIPNSWTRGVLLREDGVPFCVTLERGWKNNERGVSCIAPGEYLMKRAFYEKGGYATFEIICPPREEVKLHIGNFEEDTHGCVLTGEQFEPVYKTESGRMEEGILKSGVAFGQFMEYLDGESEARLVIIQI